MFTRLPNATGRTVQIVVDGTAVDVPADGSVAAALLVLGRDAFRKTPARGVARGPFCMMGVCFDCFVTIDGVANQRSCLVPVRPNVRVETGRGAPKLCP